MNVTKNQMDDYDKVVEHCVIGEKKEARYDERDRANGKPDVWVLDPKDFENEVSKGFMKDDKPCAEAVVAAGCRALGIPAETLMQAALGFGGGFGLAGHVCGAISGAAMILGLAVCRREADRMQQIMKTWGLVLDLQRQVERRFGSLQCRDICGLDLTKPNALQELDAGGSKRDKCDPFLRFVANRLGEELLVLGA